MALPELAKTAKGLESALCDLLFSTPGTQTKSGMKSIFQQATGENQYADVSDDDLETEEEETVIDEGSCNSVSEADDEDAINLDKDEDETSESSESDDYADDDLVSGSESDLDDGEMAVELDDTDEEAEPEISKKADQKSPNLLSSKVLAPNKPPVKRSKARVLPSKEPPRNRGRQPKVRPPVFDPESYTPKPFKRNTKKGKTFFTEQNNNIKLMTLNKLLAPLDSPVLVSDLFGKNQYILPALTGYLRTIIVLDNTNCDLYAMTLGAGLPPRVDHDSESILWRSGIVASTDNKRECAQVIDKAIEVLVHTYLDCTNFDDSINPCTILASELCDGKQGASSCGFLLAVVDSKVPQVYFYPFPKVGSSTNRSKARVSLHPPKMKKHFKEEAFLDGNRNLRTMSVLKFPNHSSIDFAEPHISDSDYRLELQAVRNRFKKELENTKPTVSASEILNGAFKNIAIGVHSSALVPEFARDIYMEMYDMWFDLLAGSSHEISLSAAQGIDELSRIAPDGSLGSISSDAVQITIKDTGRKSKWPPTAEVAFQAFKTTGGGTEIVTVGVAAETIRLLIKTKNKTSTKAKPSLLKKSASPKKKSQTKKSVSPKKAVKSPKDKAQPLAKEPKPKKEASKMMSYRGVIVPESIVNADRQALLDMLKNCNKTVTTASSPKPKRVGDMPHEYSSTEDLRKRCVDLFYGQNKGTPTKRKNEETALAPSKRTKTMDIKSWLVSNITPSNTPQEFAMRVDNKQWIVNISAKVINEISSN